ncbi:homeobox protein siamois-like [Rana temporaria]|uniref:homeobox protein siamois-like n=1 Tax=Rana temporaria TaxID=8407 RepID=UPI001AACFE44|nr:homeobox protein siamois-like [Rana temporaria]
MDTELDQVLCTVLSLEEDYLTMSPPLRFQDNFTSTPCISPDDFLATQIQKDLQDSITLQQEMLEIYTLFVIQQEAHNKNSIILKEHKYIINQNPLKRNLEEVENAGSKQPRVQIEDFPNSNTNKRCIRRTNYTNEQTTFLINEFARNPYPNFTKRCRIAKIIGISEPKIQVWFQNRRARYLPKHKNSQYIQGRHFSTPEDLSNIFQNEYQNLQINGHFQIPENTWML